MLSFTSDAKYKPSKMLYSHILRNLNQLRLKNKFCDLQLLTKDGKVYNMHKCVFVAACKRQFDIACSRDSDLPMTKLCKMILPDISSNELGVVIGFIYGESIGVTHKPMLQEALAKLHMLDLLEELKSSETSQRTLQNSASQTCLKDLDSNRESEKSPQSTTMHMVSDSKSIPPLSNENGYVEMKEEPVVEVEVYQPDKDPPSVSSDTLKLQTKEKDMTNSISENRNRLNVAGIIACGLRMNPEIEKHNEISPQRNTILHNISSSKPLLSSQNQSIEIKEEVVAEDEFQDSVKVPQSVSYDIQKQKTAETNDLNIISENDNRFNEVDINVACDLQVDPDIENETNNSLQNDIAQNRFNYASRYTLDMCNKSRDKEFKEKPAVVEEVEQSEKDTPSVLLDILTLQSKDANFANNNSDNRNRIVESCDTELTTFKRQCEELMNSKVITYELKTEEDEKIEKLRNQISDKVELSKSLQPSQRTECDTEIDITAESSQKLHTWSDDYPKKTNTVSSFQIIDSHDNTAEHAFTKDSESIEIQTDVVKGVSSDISCAVSISTCSSQQQATSKMTPRSKYKMILPHVIPPSEFQTLSCLLSSRNPTSKPGQTVKTSDKRDMLEKNTEHSYNSNLSDMSKCQSSINNPCHNTSNNSMSTEVMQHKTIATILALPPLIPTRIAGTKSDIEIRPECYRRHDWNDINRKEAKNSDQACLSGNQYNASETDDKGHEDEHTKEYRKKPSVDIKLTTGETMMIPNISESKPEPQREKSSLESSSQTLFCKLEKLLKPPPGYKQKLTVKMKRNTGSKGKKKIDSDKVMVKTGISVPLQALLKETSKNDDSSPVIKIPVINHLEQEPTQSFSVLQNTQDPTKSVSTKLQNNESFRTLVDYTPLQASLKETSKHVDFSPVCTAFDHQGKEALQVPTESVSTSCDINEKVRVPSPLCDGNVSPSCAGTPSAKDTKEVVGEKDDTVQCISRKLTLAEQIHLQRNRKNKRKLSKPMKRLGRETEVVFDKTESSFTETGKPVDIVTASLSKNDLKNRERNEDSVKCAKFLLNARFVQDETKIPVTSEPELYQESITGKGVIDMSITDTNSVFTREIISQAAEHSSLSSREKKSIAQQTGPKRGETFDAQSSIGKNNIGSISERSPEITKLLSRHTDDVPKFDFGVSKNVETTSVPNCHFNKPGKQQENPKTGQGLIPVQILISEDSSVMHKTGNNVSNNMSDNVTKSTNTFIESEKVSEANLVNSKCLSDLNKRKRNKPKVRRHESPVKSYMSVNQLLQIKPKLPENNSTKTLVRCSENLENKAVIVSNRKRQLSLPDGLERFNKSKRIEMKTNNRHRGKFGKTVDYTNEKNNASSCGQGGILHSNVGEPVTFGIKETSSNNAIVETVDNDFQNRKANVELAEVATNTTDRQPENIPQQTIIVISPSLQGLMKCYEKPLRFTPEQMVPSKYVEYDVTAPASLHKLPTEKPPQEKTLNKLKKSYPQPVRSYRPIAPKKTDDKSSS